ncbi:PfkB domain protein [Isosphaera pallida ATCC 43644]|uniref:PfkB domain protein n=1 Tax=Isosphaera pallida (strain ATCC 43644 / DSM 9630 / IS1B) TaxID=575540 RepID=E8R5D9_ISOPI|nr:carbohydrate kinase family protein [Isosphaera pallida]ADV60680.1 PfkB domain protein [Isosphaera pallida ATCC 43644]
MSRPSPTVVCAGVVVADHLSPPISHLPRAGELVACDDLVLAIGGCASNAAAALAKLGVHAAVLGKVGDDVFGRFVAETLRAQGVDDRLLAIDRSRATSQTLIVNVKGEDRRFIHCFGANQGLTVGDLAAAFDSLWAEGASPSVFYLGGYLILPGVDPTDLAAFLHDLRGRGITTLLDVATPGPADYLSKLTPVLPEVDVFLPNTDEAKLILGESDPIRQAQAFRDLGTRRVVVTMGEAGAVALSDHLRAKLGVFPVEFVDGTGGGDAFDAGYIAGLLDGLDEVGCLTFASALGASCVRAVGTTAGLFNRKQLQTFIQDHTLPIERLA